MELDVVREALKFDYNRKIYWFFSIFLTFPFVRKFDKVKINKKIIDGDALAVIEFRGKHHIARTIYEYRLVVPSVSISITSDLLTFMTTAARTLILAIRYILLLNKTTVKRKKKKLK